MSITDKHITEFLTEEISKLPKDISLSLLSAIENYQTLTDDQKVIVLSAMYVRAIFEYKLANFFGMLFDIDNNPHLVNMTLDEMKKSFYNSQRFA